LEKRASRQLGVNVVIGLEYYKDTAATATGERRRSRSRSPLGDNR